MKILKYLGVRMRFFSSSPATCVYFISLLMVSINIFYVTMTHAHDEFQGQSLKFLTPPDYLDPKLVNLFEQQFNAKIDFAYYEISSECDEMLAASDGHGHDILATGGYDIQKYYKRDWLAPIDASVIPNLKHIEARWVDAFPFARSHAVPYFWGILGIAYRQDLFPRPITSWKQILQPSEVPYNKIVLNRDPRDLTAIALKALGYSINSNDRAQFEQAGQLLQAQQPYVKDYRYIDLSARSPLVSGEVWASVVYSGDALVLNEFEDEIVYAAPDEGSNLWVDYLVILNRSSKKKLAAAFINFLNEPTIAARNAEYVYYATPNQSAKEYLPHEHLENSIIYPSDDYLARCETYQSLNPRTQKQINMMMVRLLR